MGTDCQKGCVFSLLVVIEWTDGVLPQVGTTKLGQFVLSTSVYGTWVPQQKFQEISQNQYNDVPNNAALFKLKTTVDYDSLQ